MAMIDVPLDVFRVIGKHKQALHLIHIQNNTKVFVGLSKCLCVDGDWHVEDYVFRLSLRKLVSTNKFKLNPDARVLELLGD